MGWPKTYDRVLILLNSLHNNLYHKPFISKVKLIKLNHVIFPFRLSYWHLFQAVIEKKAWNKIWGARFIIKDRLLNK
jgi:hypothetical protein